MVRRYFFVITFLSALFVTLIPTQRLQAEIETEKLGKIGLLFGSYGDVDRKQDVELLVKNTILDPDIVPIPHIMRQSTAQIYWKVDGKRYLEGYRRIDFKSGLLERSQDQAEAVAENLRNQGYDANGYVGFSLVPPFVSHTMGQMQSDGVDTIIIFNQGAQYSRLTVATLFRDVINYLKDHPEYRPRLIGINSFGRDPRFIRILGDALESELIRMGLNEKDRSKVHIFLPIHGVPLAVAKSEDPYQRESLYALEALKRRFRAYHLSFGYQNHGESPVIKWTSPNEHKALEDVISDNCEDVLIYGRISYTLDFFNSIFEMNIEQREHIEEHSKMQHKSKEVYVSKMFNSEKPFVDLMATLAIESLMGIGDIVELKVP